MLKIIATDLNRFMTCNGSRLMGVSAPINADKDTTARDEGNAAHFMANAVFQRRHTISELIDRKAPNGVIMSGEMGEHVQSYLNITGQQNAYNAMEAETSHAVTNVDGSGFQVDGRADHYDISLQQLTISDFKYGYGIEEPDNNWTLISHAIGVYQRFYNRNHPVNKVTLQIFQPRPFHPDGPLRRWEIDIDKLFELHRQLQAALNNPRDELVTSNHCTKCPSLVPCPAARNASMNAIDTTTMIYEDDIDNEALKFNLDTLNRASDMIEARKKAFEELAKHRIKVGQVIDNYSLFQGYGHTTWNKGINAAMLQILTGKDLQKPKLETPAEAKRLGVSEVILDAITYRPKTDLKLVRGRASKQAEKLLGKK